MKNLNKVDIILGIKVRRHGNWFTLNQSYYIEKLLNKFNYFRIKKVNTLYDLGMKLAKMKEELLHN